MYYIRRDSLVIQLALWLVCRQSRKVVSQQPNKGFTLIEILITASLVVVVGLAVYSTFSSGIKVWQRLNKGYIEEDVNIFFEKIFTDLRNSFEYKGIDFVGKKNSLSFATLVTTNSFIPGLRRGPGQVRYLFDAENKEVRKEKRNLSDIYKQKQGFIQRILESVESLKFEYYFYDSEKRDYFWVDEWKNQSLPLAVRIRLELNYGGKSYKFTRTVNIPLAKEEI